MTHICVSELTTTGSDNGLSPGRRQVIIWTNAGILLIRPLGTNFSEIIIGVQTFSFKKMELNMSSAKWRPFYLDLNELIMDSRDFLSIFFRVTLLTWLHQCHFFITSALFRTIVFIAKHNMLAFAYGTISRYMIFRIFKAEAPISNAFFIPRCHVCWVHVC